MAAPRRGRRHTRAPERLRSSAGFAVRQGAPCPRRHPGLAAISAANPAALLSCGDRGGEPGRPAPQRQALRLACTCPSCRFAACASAGASLVWGVSPPFPAAAPRPDGGREAGHPRRLLLPRRGDTPLVCPDHTPSRVIQGHPNLHRNYTSLTDTIECVRGGSSRSSPPTPARQAFADCSDPPRPQ